MMVPEQNTDIETPSPSCQGEDDVSSVDLYTVITNLMAGAEEAQRKIKD